MATVNSAGRPRNAACPPARVRKTPPRGRWAPYRQAAGALAAWSPSASTLGRTPMIEVRGLTKRYGDKLAVDGLTFTVRPGVVTGFLGPHGAGKSTTIRMILGLDKPTAGSATVNGRRYAEHPAPLCEAGALLEAKAVDPGRTARNHLLALAATTGISRRRVDAVVDMVGLRTVAGKRSG